MEIKYLLRRGTDVDELVRPRDLGMHVFHRHRTGPRSPTRQGRAAGTIGMLGPHCAAAEVEGSRGHEQGRSTKSVASLCVPLDKVFSQSHQEAQLLPFFRILVELLGTEARRPGGSQAVATSYSAVAPGTAWAMGGC